MATTYPLHTLPRSASPPAMSAPSSSRRSRDITDIPVRILPEEHSPSLVYFSSVSENTHRFVESLQLNAARVPLRPRTEGRLRVSQPYVLIVPTYGGGDRSGAVPRQVAMFLNDPANRSLLRGVIAAGNTNFGEHFCLAGPVISAKCGVPELYRFELLGTARDTARAREGLDQFWAGQRRCALSTG